MTKLRGTFSQLGISKVLVIGDLLLDTYTIGKARRISPEAPVAIVQVKHEEHRPGGSGNVVLNLVSLGSEVVAVGRIGPDASGQLLLESLRSENVIVDGIVVQNDFKTPVKNRIIAENQQIVRVDYEEVIPIPEMLEQQIIEALPKLLEGVKVVAISDYGKGFLSKTLISAVIEQANRRNIPTIADPKGIDFSKYQGTTIIKPNLSEAIAAAGLPPEAPLEQVAAKVLSKIDAEILMVTRSEAGISLFWRDGRRQDFPVRMKEVKDVTGAGDTVLAMLACAIANNLEIEQAVQLSNIAAGIAIERFGCARITLSELARRLLELDVANKVFDEEHLFALQEAIKGTRCLLLGLSGQQGLTSTIFSAIQKLSERKGDSLLIYVRDAQPDEEFVRILTSLHDVHFVVINSDSMRHLCELIDPDEVYSIENNQLRQLSHKQAVLV